MKEYIFQMPLRWMDMDAYQHVNNGRYCDYMVEARFHWFHQNEYLKNWIEQDGIQFVMVKQSIEYIQAFTFPDEIKIVQTISRIGRSSVDFDYELYSVSYPDRPYAKAQATLAAFSPKLKKSVEIPQIIKEHFELDVKI